MSRPFVFALGLAAGLAASAPAAAGSYVCNLPRALLCENCARDLTIALMPNGACHVSFTAGVASTARTQRTTLRFAVIAPTAKTWRSRVAAKPAAASQPVSGRCFAFNGNQYCE